MVKRLLVTAMCALVMMGPLTESRAVTEIDGVHWHGTMTTIPASGRTFGVTFLARTTATDIASGVAFAIHERDAGANDVLFDVRLPWDSPPAVGQEIRVWIDFRVYCESGRLIGESARQWSISWCDPVHGTQVRMGLQATHVSIGSSDPEPFEFVLADDAGVEDDEPSAEDHYTCTTTSAAADDAPVLFPSPFDLLSHGLPITTETGPFGARRSARDELAGRIQIAFDLAGEQLCGQIPSQSLATMYVVARATGAALCGITGAELRVIGIPGDWIASAAAPPMSISLGDPLGPVGGNMAYTQCQATVDAPVLLYTISLFATSAVSHRLVEVIARNPPANSLFPCPLITLCDSPLYSIVCMEGSKATINPSSTIDCAQPPVGAARQAWTAIKDLYR